MGIGEEGSRYTPRRRKVGNRQLCVRMGGSLSEEEAATAANVGMDENFVHQLNGAAFSYILMDLDGIAQDGVGNTSTNDLRQSIGFS